MLSPWWCGGARAVVLGARTFDRVVIYDYQRAVLFRRGRLVRTLGAGAYWLVRPVHRCA